MAFNERVVTGKKLKEQFNRGQNPSFKYSELLKTNLQNTFTSSSKDQRQLPGHFKVVLEAFKALDQAIKLTKIKKPSCFLSDLKQIVEK